MALKVCFHTLGCKLNFAESSTLAREFQQAGFERVSTQQHADVHVINSCSVTEHANKKCRNLIHKIVRTQPQAIIAVTGCYAQLRPTEIAHIEGVDIVLGNSDKGSLTSRVEELCSRGKGTAHTCQAGELKSFFAAYSSGDRTRSFLKVQDGCNYYCSYCTIPLARGESRNIAINKIIPQAQAIAAAGTREIVITGINTGDFGRSTGENFLDLLKALEPIEGIERYRISSIEPNLLTDEIIEFCAQSSKFQPHFHIPIQSGSDRILTLMHRRYNTDLFARRIEALRNAMDDLFIGIDIIAGFPSESDEDFETAYRFMEKLAPSFLHVFPYSVRPNTPAADMPNKIPAQVIQERVKRLTELSDRLHLQFATRFIGSCRKVLFESDCKNGTMFGYTDNYIKVHTPYNPSFVGTIQDVELRGDGTSAELEGVIKK